MKTKLLIILISSILTCSQAYSQFSVGIVGFPQISMLTDTRDAVQSNVITFAGGGGITAGYNFSKKIGLQIGVLYSSQNQKIRSNYTIADSAMTHNSKKRFDYIKIPVLLKYSQKIGKKANFVFSAGPQLSYLLKYDGGMIVYIPNVYYDLPTTPPDNNYYNKFVLDAVVQAGVEYGLTNKIDFTAGVKVDYSLTATENKNVVYNGFPISNLGLADGTAHNITVALMVGLSYNLAPARDLLSPSNKFRGKASGKQRRH